MLDQPDIDFLTKYLPLFNRWKEHGIFSGFGSEGIAGIANIYKKITGNNANMNCNTCTIKATELVYREYEAFIRSNI